MFLARAVDPSSAASTFGSVALLAAARRDPSIPLGQVEWGPRQGWNNARLPDAAAAARALRGPTGSGGGVPRGSGLVRGGVLINDAGAAVPELALLCGLCMHAFQLPVGLNVYSTPAPSFDRDDAPVPAAAGIGPRGGKGTSGSAPKGAKGFAARAPTKRPAPGPAAAVAAAALGDEDARTSPPTCFEEARETPPHTDGQDVLAVATAGAKRWRVYARPRLEHLRPPSLTAASPPDGDPYNLGKGAHCLRSSTLGAPVVDEVLLPGDALFIPAGFPHETFAVRSSLVGSDADDGARVAAGGADPCAVHLTFGFATLLWGLTFATLRRVSEAVQASGAEPHDEGLSADATQDGDDDDDDRDWDAALRARLQAPLPVGFAADRPALLAEARALAGLTRGRRSTPGREADAAAAAAAAVLSVDDDSLSAAATFLEHHCDTLVGLLTEAYAAASALDAPPYALRAKANEAAIAEVLENILF
jgi:hypothetical protein